VFLWSKRGGPKDRRRAARAGGEGLRAFYWTGGVSHPSSVRNISRSGAYVETEAAWGVGTVLYLVLDQKESDQPAPGETGALGLWARVVRAEPSGMAVEFVNAGREEARLIDSWERASADLG
jgi:hypothetical protein